MKVVLQKVQSAQVQVDNSSIATIDIGYVLLLGIMHGDTEAQADWLASKITSLRLFTSAAGKINDQNIVDVCGSVLVVSQFTLAANIQNGNRPDYTSAMSPQDAKKLYTYFVQKLQSLNLTVVTGQFGANMHVSLVNDGPVTLILERNP